MPASQDRHLVSQLVTRGLLTPAQANQTLTAAREAEDSGTRFDLRKFVSDQRFMTPRRYDEFVQELKAPKSVPKPPAAAPPKKKPDDLPLPYDIGGFRLVEEIGRGGMGAVYKALQVEMRRYVAVKILPRKSAEDPVYVKRFRREAQAAAALNHPNIVLPISVDEDRGLHYLAMEFVDGVSLGVWMAKEGRLRWKEAIDLAVQIGRGLEHAHGHKLIHRDIKPDNILLDRPSRLAKIVDLGLAKRTTDQTNITNADKNPVGTAYYVSPEQARGESNLDGRTDIYSLGATLWHMLVGVPPFDGPNAAVILTKHITEPVPDPRTSVSDCPEGLVQVIMKAMAKKREDRYEDCTLLCEDLEAVLAGRRPKYARTARAPGAARGAPLVIPTSGGTQAGARLRDPSSPRLRDPSKSRSRSPAASRHRKSTTSHGTEVRSLHHSTQIRPKEKASAWLNVIILAILLLACLIVIIVLAQRGQNPQTSPGKKKPDKVGR